LIRLLNPKIRGWANYYRHVVSKKTFSYVDNAIFRCMWKWSARRHPKKGARWIKKKYFQRQGMRSWVFSGQTIDRQGAVSPQRLIRADDTAIRRHIKVRSDANPYDTLDEAYFEQRSHWPQHNYLTGVTSHILSVL